MAWSIAKAAPEQYGALQGVLEITAEHLERVDSASHWYPFELEDWFTKYAENREFYAIMDEEHIIGTFCISEEEIPYYNNMGKYWKTSDPALYLGALAILPYVQGRGAGTWCFDEIHQLVRSKGHNRLRFDAPSHDQQLLGMCEKCGFERKGMLLVGRFLVVPLEKELA